MSLPFVTLDAIPPHGLHVDLGAAGVQAWALSAAAEGIEGEIRALSGRLRILRYGVHILVDGELTASGTVSCDRCRHPLPLSVSGQVNCLYSPIDTVPERSEEEEGDYTAPVQLPVEVNDLGEYDGKALDLCNVVREFFAVERPPRLLCEDVAIVDAAGNASLNASINAATHAAINAAACTQRFKARLSTINPASMSDAANESEPQSPFAKLASLKFKKEQD